MAARNPKHDTPRRAIGIIRVSRVAGREGESFASPGEQRQRIETECERRDLHLIDVHEELDVSGGAALEDRAGLRAALEMVEAGKAEVIVAAYFDRLMRSLRVQSEVVQRVEAAGGEVLAIDVGQVTEGTAGQWLSGTMLGAVSEYQRRTTTERTAAAQARAVARGATPWARVPLGYDRTNGTLSPNPREVPIVERAFAMRADGEAMSEIRKMLRSEGVERSPRGVQVMLANRIYLGEIHFGKLVNLAACEPIIDRELFDRVQRMVVPRGRKPKSTRLLSRLGVLRCGSCGARLSAMKLPKQNDYPVYRCPSNSDCERHLTISAVIAEGVVVKATRAALRDIEGRASAQVNARQAREALAAAEAARDAAISAFDGLGDLQATKDRLAQLQAAVDDACERVSQLGDTETALVINMDHDWDELTLDEQRACIRAIVKRATVAPGRGAPRGTSRTARAADRISVEMR